MRPRWISIAAILPLAALLLAVTGCGNRARYELLERDLRWQEDDLYSLEDELDEVCAQLESCRRENDTLRDENAQLRQNGGNRPSSPSSSSPRRLFGSSPAEMPAEPTPSVELGQPSEALPPLLRGTDKPGAPSPSTHLPQNQAPPFQGPPIIDPLPPDAMPPETRFPGPRFAPPGAVEELPPGDVEILDAPPRVGRRTSAFEAIDAAPSGLGSLLGGKDETPIDEYVTQITLNRLMTGGHNVDGHLGDEGLIVVVEPRNAAGQVVRVRGKLSLVVLDPAERGAAARVARWDFVPGETAAQFREGVFGKGLKFELRWPNRPPVHRDLRLYARLTTEDDRVLEVDGTIRVELPARKVGQWSAVGPAAPTASD